jgi:ribonuclease Z
VEDDRYRFDPERLAAQGVAPGRRLADMKVRFLAGEDRAQAEALGTFIPGRRIAYVTDTGFSTKSVEAVRRLAAGADVLYCEATYPDADAAKAEGVRHLTGGQCGAMARAAEAQRLVPFHFSRRYAHDPAELLADVERGRSGERDWLGEL